MVYSFHVKDRTVSLSSLSCPQESQASAWAMLEWRLEVDHAEEEEEDDDKDTEIVSRPVKGEFDSEKGELQLLNMPLHILELIMEFCIGVEYLKFRATCKRGCLAAPSIQWSNKTRLKSYSLASPWLMVLDNYRDIITFIDPRYGDRYFIRTPQELKGGYEIYYSRYGWLLMYKNKDESRLVFFNPFTSNIRKLPDVGYWESFCFSAPPTSPDCMVVGFSRHGSLHVAIHFVSLESTWCTYQLNFNLAPYSFHFPTFSGRDIYFLCDNERIEAFRDMADDDHSWELVADKAPSRSLSQYFLSTCDQHLLLVIVGEFGGLVEVFKLDKSTQEWEKIDELGKHMIYISNTTCFCLEAKSPEMGNKIYFPRLSDDKNSKIVFYSLETCRYHTFDDNNIQESLGANFFATKQIYNPHTWIEPSWS
ncbi:hypothetical protein L1987_00187 [Smallanthus sonchifolius]|uniref:Uncharacterized protein n=1 Tax=Smallanthus sonchifolius TaxID=185202 RepID=A0ACB9K1K3_9ASTR|nr:hypothetical protein L1987_00187 [Smallanthus sonchifolius]